MKSIFKRAAALILALTLTLSALPVVSLASGGWRDVYTDGRYIADNLRLTKTVSWSDATGRGQSYTLSLSPYGDAYPIVSVGDTVYGRTTISEVAAFEAARGRNVLAAVNADFFSLQTGVPLGILIENGVYKSGAATSESAIGFTATGEMFVTRNARVELTLTNQGDGEANANAGKTAATTSFNKYRTDTGGLYIFTSAFSEVSTRTASPGWFVRMKILEGAPSVNGEMTLLVEETINSDGEIPIGEGYVILTAANQSGYREMFEQFAVGDIIKLTSTCDDPRLAEAQWATGGGDILVENGAVADSATWDKALLVRAPKTAIGVTADGSIVTLIADGRNTTYYNGLDMQELADEMLARGCVTAVNLDGGGSSAILTRQAGQPLALLNNPSDGKERACATYILFVTDAISDGFPTRLSAANNGALVLSGSQIPLEPVAADSALNSAPLPADVTATSAGRGAFDGLLYTAGTEQGADAIALASPSTGAAGAAELFVVVNPTTIYAAKDILTYSVYLRPGETYQLAPAATFYRMPVLAQNTSFTFTASPELGEVTPDGLFTAALTASAEGDVTIAAGDKTATVHITIEGFTDTVGHWAQEYVNELARSGVVKGVSATEFAPEAEIIRGDFILMLYRAAGSPQPIIDDQPTIPVEPSQEPSQEPPTEPPTDETPEVSPESSPETTEDATPEPEQTPPLEPTQEPTPPPLQFDDVSPTDYYADAIAWAKSVGIAAGTGDGKFEPQSTLTREQAFTFVYRALNVLKIAYEDVPTESLASYPDISDLADYAAVPTATLTAYSIVSGSDGGYLVPRESLTRAQMAKVLCLVLRLPRVPLETPSPDASPSPTPAPLQTPSPEPTAEQTPESTPELTPEFSPEPTAVG
ncbi:MAG: phosphodiester glycosidase family protein [Oscillospiraceae bacterium]|jgi:exopolysaccharide biosynthesis protein|nr:phosphodiester glycosidase family protein [Oscillospiraceae bacterium]